MSYPITYWYGIPEAFVCRERLQEAKEAGFTVIECRYSKESNLRVLELCAELGLGAFVYDERMQLAVDGADGWEDALRAMIRDYRDCPALLQWFVKDEPTDAMFSVLGRIAAFMRENDPAHPVYINLLPLVAVLPIENYERHVRGFLEAVHPALLSYDHYNLMKREVPSLDGLIEAAMSPECRARNHWEDKLFAAYDRGDYYNNLEIIRTEAARVQIPWMQIILLVEHWDYRWLTEGEVRWEAFTSLAYGSSMLSYFTYWTPGVAHTEPWSYHHGIIESDGTRGEKYETVKQINRELQTLHTALDGAASTGVFHVGPESDALVHPFAGFAGLQAVCAERAVLGFFENNLFVAVNKLHHEEQTMTFTCAGPLLHLDKKTGTWLPLADKTYRFAPGDGELFRLG